MADVTTDVFVGGYPDRAYEDKAPYAFTGTVKRVVFDLMPSTHEDEHALHAAAQQAAVAHGVSG